MNPIRLILTDFGGVLYRSPNPLQLQRWLRLLGIRSGAIIDMLYTSPRESDFIRALYTGKKNEQQLWEELTRSWKAHPGMIRLLRRSSYSRRRLNRRLVTYLAGLRPRFRTAVLTNAGTDFRSTFCAAYRLEHMFDMVIISAEEGLCKPDADIFYLAAQRMRVEPSETVFMDDMLENVEAAQAVGMRAFAVQDERSAVRQLRAILGE